MIAPLERAGPFGFPLTVAENQLGLHGARISQPVLSAIRAKTIGPNARGGENGWRKVKVGKGSKFDKSWRV